MVLSAWTRRLESGGRRRSRAGFTLMEMGIVLGVLSILAAAVVPEVIEGMRTNMISKVAEDMAAIEDAARMYERDQNPFRWPGEGVAVNCTFNETTAKSEMGTGGYYTNSTAAYTNPWSRTYELDLYRRAGGNHCFFRVTTLIPSSLAGVFTSLVPQGICSSTGCGGTGAIPTGFSRCCSKVARPAGRLFMNGGAIKKLANCAVLDFGGAGLNNIKCAKGQYSE